MFKLFASFHSRPQPLRATASRSPRRTAPSAASSRTSGARSCQRLVTALNEETNKESTARQMTRPLPHRQLQPEYTLTVNSTGFAASHSRASSSRSDASRRRIPLSVTANAETIEGRARPRHQYRRQDFST